MPARKMRTAAALAGGLVGATMLATSSGAAGTLLDLTHVPAPNPKAAGVSSPNALSPELAEIEAARGSIPLENGTALISHYGYNGDGPMLPTPGDVQAVGHNVEASKSEPDKNVYLVLEHQRGADPLYDYGTHFLFQGHEIGKQGYVTRINLDADTAHRVTLIATNDENGPLPTYDGITWDPFRHKLLLASEHGNSPTGGVWAISAELPASGLAVGHQLPGFGFGGYEGIQNDAQGNVLVVEDIGGTTVPTKARQPNSFVYKFVPRERGSLEAGALYALQVTSARSGQPITFHAADAVGDTFSPDVADLHTYGKSFGTMWVLVHDTASDGAASFDANLAAKAAGATPFKRPENGVFRPGTGFREYYFTETGDTNTTSTANDGFGGWGAVFRLVLDEPGSMTGTLSPFALGDQAHTGFDNIAFASKNALAVVEDASDGVHTSRNALDSGYLYDASRNYADGTAPLRFLAEGRDPSATIDSALSGSPGFQNDGDNEITGIHFSDGDASVGGILGAKVPHTFRAGWRAFYTAQHGDNITWELIKPGLKRRS
ncbi:MAG: alkaline phosphatase PhoX [Actinomycetota bacterium]